MRVYAGLDPDSRKRRYLTETVPAGPAADREAEAVRARLLAEVEDLRAARTRQGDDQGRPVVGSALARLDRDVLAQSGIAWLVVFEGVNDIGGSPATDAGRRQVADELIDAHGQIIVQAHAQGIRVHGATLLPFGGNGYDDSTGYHEAARQTVNDWIRTSGSFDAVVDFDQVVRDPAQPRRLKAAYDSGDHLHLNPTGYRALADAVPARLFTTP
jgi:lysophospholipase L1-like esterase